MSHKLSLVKAYELFLEYFEHYEFLSEAYRLDVKRLRWTDDKISPDSEKQNYSDLSPAGRIWSDFLVVKKHGSPIGLPAGPATRVLKYTIERELEDFKRNRLSSFQRQYGITLSEQEVILSEDPHHAFSIAVTLLGDKFTDHGIEQARTVNFNALKKLILDKKTSLIAKLPHDDYSLKVEIFDHSHSHRTDKLAVFLSDESDGQIYTLTVDERGNMDSSPPNPSNVDLVLRVIVGNVLKGK